MNRAKNTPVTKKRRKKTLKLAKGYFGSKKKLFKTAKEQLMNALVDSYQGRKKRAGQFRRVWISNLNYACRERNLNYSKFIRLINLAQIRLNRKQLSEMAIKEPKSFDNLLEKISNPWT